MGNADSTQKLGERVVVAQAKLAQDKAVQSERYEYLKANSPKLLDAMVQSTADSLQSFAPFLDGTLLIAWMHDEEQCKKAILDSCRKVLNAPIHNAEYEWFKEHLFPLSIWMFKTKENNFMYQELLDIAKNMSHHIIDSMDSIYELLQSHKKWQQIMDIKNESFIPRQDHPKVGLLQQEGLADIFNSDSKTETDDEKKADDMKSFIDGNFVINILTATATNINNEFQNHVKTVMSHYGSFKSGPIKKVQRCVAKTENDYQYEEYPKAAKLLDLIRCSITFNTVDQLIIGYNGLMKHISINSWFIELGRIKNGFSNPTQGGYRDIKVNVLYKSQINLGVNMICEIQLLLINYLEEKKRIHKLYSIIRDEIYFQMVVQSHVKKDKEILKGLKFVDALNVGQEVTLNYIGTTIGKCSVDSQAGLLCMEGENWFGVIDMKQKKTVIEMERDAPFNPWYGRVSHRWISIDGDRYLSIQMSKTEIKMFLVTKDHKFIENEKFRVTVASDSIINYVDFDRKFENIFLVTGYSILQKRSMSDINTVTHSIELEEKIVQSSFRQLRLSDSGNLCSLGGGGYKNYFYLIDIQNKKQYKMISDVLSDTYAPCFINGEDKYISMSDKNGRVEIWDIDKRKPVNTIKIDATQWVTCSASVNNILAIGCLDKKLRLYDVSNWECFYAKQYNVKACSLDLTSDLKYLTLGGLDGDRCVVLQIE